MRQVSATVLIAALTALAPIAGTAPGRVAPPTSPAAKEPERAKDATFAADVLPFLNKHCIKCHGGAKPRGDVALDVYKDEAAALKNKGPWLDVVQNIRAGTMPPKDRPRPDSAEIERVAGWIDAQLSKDSGTAGAVTAVPLRRLNRTEYNRTIRDLIGLDFQPAADFPADSTVFGFDNIGLSIGSEVVIQRYLKAAADIVERTFKDPQLKKRIMICGPTDKDAARRIVEGFARRAYRRPVTSQEVDRVVKGLVEPALKKDENFDSAIKVALKAILVSPHFLFRVELEREADGPDGVHPLSEFELATRLSYFLWSSMPDDELFKQAQQGTLRKNLEAQVRRMLKDPKSAGLIENFFGQWLELRMIQSVAPDPKKFPTFNDDLRSAMVKETELFCEAIVKEDRSILDFLDADFTFVNEPLARHYGIEGVKGEQLRRVTLTGKARQQRGGILTQASILTATSKPTGTSPPKRGKWIMDNILATPPKPPPPDVDDLPTEERVPKSLRQRLELHRTNPACATCHDRLDPLGFALEPFDAIGGWRTMDGKFPIDAAAILPSGESFDGPDGLKKILKSKSEDFSRSLTEKMLIYALGRGVGPADKPTVQRICESLKTNHHRFSGLVLGIVQSDPFQKRKSKGAGK